MKFIPILFSTPMVQAILESRKTMTRRIVKGLPDNASDDLVQIMVSGYHNTQGHVKCPYGQPGDVLWVREKFTKLVNCDTGDFHSWGYYADMPEKFHKQYPHKYKPSIHMPKVACRLFLKIKNIRVERLLDITEEDVKAEGVQWVGCANISGTKYGHKYGFELLWQQINGFGSWKENPWVWVIEFEGIKKPKNFK